MAGWQYPISKKFWRRKFLIDKFFEGKMVLHNYEKRQTVEYQFLHFF